MFARISASTALSQPARAAGRLRQTIQMEEARAADCNGARSRQPLGLDRPRAVHHEPCPGSAPRPASPRRRATCCRRRSPAGRGPAAPGGTVRKPAQSRPRSSASTPPGRRRSGPRRRSARRRWPRRSTSGRAVPRRPCQFPATAPAGRAAARRGRSPSGPSREWRRSRADRCRSGRSRRLPPRRPAVRPRTGAARRARARRAWRRAGVRRPRPSTRPPGRSRRSYPPADTLPRSPKPSAVRSGRTCCEPFGIVGPGRQRASAIGQTADRRRQIRDHRLAPCFRPRGHRLGKAAYLLDERAEGQELAVREEGAPPAGRARAAARGLSSPVGTSTSSPNTTPVLSAFGAIVSRTRLAPFFASQRVLSSGIVARHPLQRTVRAQRYATVGVFTQRGFRGSFR